jgi:hypothetical protein
MKTYIQERKHPRNLNTQATRIIQKFGSPYKLSEALKRVSQQAYRHPSVIYRWTYPKGLRNGRGGVIPTSALQDIMNAARLEGIILTPEDLYGDN